MLEALRANLSFAHLRWQSCLLIIFVICKDTRFIQNRYAFRMAKQKFGSWVVHLSHVSALPPGPVLTAQRLFWSCLLFMVFLSLRGAEAVAQKPSTSMTEGPFDLKVVGTFELSCLISLVTSITSISSLVFLGIKTARSFYASCEHSIVGTSYSEVHCFASHWRLWYAPVGPCWASWHGCSQGAKDLSFAAYSSCNFTNGSGAKHSKQTHSHQSALVQSKA